VRVGILRGGLSDEEWVKLVDRDLFRVTRGYLSPRAQRAIEAYNTHRLYENPRRLAQLHKLMTREFNAVQRIYANSKLLTLGPGDEEETSASTLQEPVELNTSIKGQEDKL